MGCGSSSLKGEAPDMGSGLTADPPVRKVAAPQQEFNDINYSDVTDPSRRRRATERAPHETDANFPEAAEADKTLQRGHGTSTDDTLQIAGEKVEPYHTTGGSRPDDAAVDQNYAHEQRTTQSANTLPATERSVVPSEESTTPPQTDLPQKKPSIFSKLKQEYGHPYVHDKQLPDPIPFSSNFDSMRSPAHQTGSFSRPQVY